MIDWQKEVEYYEQQVDVFCTIWKTEMRRLLERIQELEQENQRLNSELEHQVRINALFDK